MHILTIPFLTTLLRISTCDTVISEEKDYNNDRRDEQVSRRFLDNLNDDEWHVAHLKETEFSERSECPSDSLQQKVDKYRQALKHDSGFVEYVSANTLPFNITELMERQKCKAPSPISDFFKTVMPISNVTKDQRGQVLVGTTLTSKHALSEEEVDGTENGKKSRRQDNQYQFSSTEYYDETPVFDHDLCPDDIEVINLEIDQLRNYDVECELTLEWRSLE